MELNSPISQDMNILEDMKQSTNPHTKLQKYSKRAHTLDNESELILCTRIKVSQTRRENNKKL